MTSARQANNTHTHNANHPPTNRHHLSIRPIIPFPSRVLHRAVIVRRVAVGVSVLLCVPASVCRVTCVCNNKPLNNICAQSAPYTWRPGGTPRIARVVCIIACVVQHAQHGGRVVRCCVFVPHTRKSPFCLPACQCGGRKVSAE